MLRGRALRLGDTVGLIAPSGAVQNPEVAARAVEAVETLGFRVVAHESCFARLGYLAGTDELRADGINRMFQDDRIDAIFAMRGGYGATRILDRLDYDAIRANPKAFVGYSDATALHAAIYKNCDMITLHGPMPAIDMLNFEPFSKECFLRALLSPAPLGTIRNPDGWALAYICPGQCEGPLVGGNLALIAALLGTPWQLDVRGKILLLEDVNEHPYRIDAMLTQLKNAGVFRDCAGVILGGFTHCIPEKNDFGTSIEAICQDILAPFAKPVLSGFAIGHVKQKITIPLGALCALDADNQRLTVLEGALT